MSSILVGLVCLLLAQGTRVWTIQELFQRNVGNQVQQSTAFPPHKIIGNIYYVGTEGLSTFLVTTPAGHIVINSNYERSVPVIRDSIAKLGYAEEIDIQEGAFNGELKRQQVEGPPAGRGRGVKQGG